MTGTPEFDVVVLAGGQGRRLGGIDKPGLSVGGTALLDRVLRAGRGARRAVAVGPVRPTAWPVEWVREDPPGGGPLAALAAGVRRTSAPLVLVMAADLPFVTSGTAAALFAALPEAADGVVLVDPSGRDQPLLAVYRAASLRRELASLEAGEPGEAGNAGLDGMPLKRLTARLALVRRADEDGEASFDTDTWEALAAARTRIREHGRVLEEWIASVKADLGIDLDVDIRVLLDLARDAAHGVDRPAAPLTTFLVGYAAGRSGGGPEAVARAAGRAAELALRWEAEAAAAGAESTGPAGSTAAPEGGDAATSEGGGPNG